MARGSRRQTETMSEATDVAITVNGLTKSYGDVSVLKGLNFEVLRGETLALLGPNGAGKSTTIEILEGYRRRDSGAVEVLGIDPDHSTLEWRSQLGIVLQSTGESGNITVAEQLREFASYYPKPRSVDEVISAVGLEEKRNTRISKLSGGQQRRVDVALGIIGKPQLLFLDEPTTGFSPEARRQFWDVIRALKSEGTTILLTTHYLDEAAQLSDRAAIIGNGELLSIGDIGNIGGPTARTPRVEWTAPDGSIVSETTEEPGRFVHQLVTTLGGEPVGLSVIRPTLDDIYLNLIEENRQ